MLKNKEKLNLFLKNDFKIQLAVIPNNSYKFPLHIILFQKIFVFKGVSLIVFLRK